MIIVLLHRIDRIPYLTVSRAVAKLFTACFSLPAGADLHGAFLPWVVTREVLVLIHYLPFLNLCLVNVLQSLHALLFPSVTGLCLLFSCYDPNLLLAELPHLLAFLSDHYLGNFAPV